MIYRVLSPNEIHRIGEVERKESVNAIAISKQDDSKTGYSITLVEVTPPIQIGSWSEKGIQARANAWKPVLEQGGFFFGALNNDHLVGFVILGPKRDDGSGVIEALFVHHDYRQSGISRRLMNRVEREAIANSIGYLALNSNATKSAMSFYMTIGFRINGENEASMGMAEGILGDIPMTKELRRV